MLSVVCPYVKYIRFTALFFSNLIAMIPTAEDMVDSWTIFEPNSIKHQVTRLYRRSIDDKPIKSSSILVLKPSASSSLQNIRSTALDAIKVCAICSPVPMHKVRDISGI